MGNFAPWGADVPISLPEPLKNSAVVEVDMGGLGFTRNGIAHQFTETTLEEYLPHFAPRQDETS